MKRFLLEESLEFNLLSPTPLRTEKITFYSHTIHTHTFPIIGKHDFGVKKDCRGGEYFRSWLPLVTMSYELTKKLL